MAKRPPRVPHAGVRRAAEEARAEQARLDAVEEERRLAAEREAEQLVQENERAAAERDERERREEARGRARAHAEEAKRAKAKAAAQRKAQRAERASDASATERRAERTAAAHRPRTAAERRRAEHRERGEQALREDRRRLNQQRRRRLVERAALEGAIKDPGTGPVPIQRTQRAAAPTAPVPARTLSTRVIALALILVISAFMLFPTVTTALRQNAELTAVQQEIAQQEAVRDRLQADVQRWRDPEFVKQQARARIHLVMPGEKQYMVTGTSALPQDQERAANPGELRQGLPWADGLWDSVVRSTRP